MYSNLSLYLVMQERLERQQHENEQEHAKLQGLVTKLEIQLTEQTRQMEEVSTLMLSLNVAVLWPLLCTWQAKWAQ